MTIDDAAVLYQNNPDVVLREEDPDGALLFNPDTNDVKVLNTSGLCIWKTCATKSSRQQIVAALRASFDGVPEDTVQAEVNGFLAALEQSGFVSKV